MSKAMKFEFKTYKLKQESVLFKLLLENYNITCDEVVIVGDEKIADEYYYKVIQLCEDGLKLIKSLTIKESSYYAKKEDLVPTNEAGIGTDSVEIEIPAEFLSVSIIEDIQRLNNLGGN